MTQHVEGCTAWSQYHPYDCPDCKIITSALGDFEERVDAAVGDIIDTETDAARADGYAEGQQVTEDAMNEEIERLIRIHEAELEAEFQKGYNRGYVDGRSAREGLNA